MFVAVEDMFGWHVRHNGSIIKTGLTKNSANNMAQGLNEVLENSSDH